MTEKLRVIDIDDDQLDITQTSSEDIMNSSLPVKQSVRWTHLDESQKTQTWNLTQIFKTQKKKELWDDLQ